MKKYINTIIKSFVLLQTLALCSCNNVMHDDMTECDLFLKFRYDYNLAYEDWFSQQVDEVKVFIFDTEGKFVETIRETAPVIAAGDYRMSIPYHMKGYTAVVWAGRTDQDYELPQMLVGDPIEKLTLHYITENKISANQMAALWHSGPHTMVFSENGGTEQTVSLTRNTNDFHVEVRSSLGSTEMTANFNIEITANNGSYDHKNDILKDTPKITYLPCGDDSKQIVDIYTMRLTKGDPIKISAKDKISGKYLVIEGKTEADLTELILKGKPSEMSDQEYLDRKYIWDISLNYNTDTYLAISITINGWTYWFHNTDL